MKTEYSTLLERFREKFGIDVSRGSLDVEQVSKQVQRLADESAQPASKLLEDAVSSRNGLFRLASIISVGETYFYRYTEQLEFLVSTVADAVNRFGSATEPIWCAGCASGEEAHSIAVMAHRLMGNEFSKKISIWGSDLNSDAISTAKVGQYGRWSFRNVPGWLLPTYFSAVSTGGSLERFELRTEIKKCTRFIHESIQERLMQSEEHQFSAVVFRNVSIYMHNIAARQTVDQMVRVIVPGGLLIIAPTDPPPEHSLLKRHPVGIPGVWQRVDGDSIAATKSHDVSTTNSSSLYPSEPVMSLPPIVDEELLCVQKNSAATEPSSPVVGAAAPDISSIRQSLNVLIANGRVTDAVAFLSEQIQISSLNYDLFYLRGKLYFDSGNFMNACGDFQKATYLYPHDDLVQFWYAMSLFEIGHFSKGKQLCVLLQNRLRTQKDATTFVNDEPSVEQLLQTLDVLLNEEQ